jgi:outer membrane lipopolysaccharide assembly protein LptE/RlpB
MRKKFIWKFQLVTISVLFILMLAGCRYQLQPQLPAAASKIAIPTFDNQTFQYGLGETLTHSVVEQFLRDGRLRVVEEKEADLILRGKITHYLKETLSEVSIGLTEYRVKLEISVALISTKDGKALWEKKVEEATTYTPTEGGGVQTDHDAVKETGKKIGEDLVNLVMEGWER